MFSSWCDEFNATPEERDDNENKRFKKFMMNKLLIDTS
jgi:hypothetical protein